MKNFIFISPHFPDSYWKWVVALKNKGFNVLGIGDAPYYEIPDQLKESLTEYYCCNGMDDYENEKRAVQYFKDKYGDIDWLESMNEYWLEKDSMLRQDFDVKNGIRYKEISKFKLKSEEKKYFKLAGSNVADYVVVFDKNDKCKILDLVKKVGFPLFAKPDNGMGSQNTFKLNSIEQVDDFFNNKIDVNYIVEEYIDGHIVSFDGVTNSNADVIFCDSHVFNSQIAQVVKDELDDFYYCLPEVPKDLEEIGRKIVKSFDVKNRFFHIEFFRTNRESRFGPAETLVALEANMRAPGGYSCDLINYANSVSCYNIFADSCAFNETSEKMDYEKYYAACVSRRYKYDYQYSHESICEKYRFNLTMVGEYPFAIRDDLGDCYYIGRFNSLEEVLEFQHIIRLKKDI